MDVIQITCIRIAYSRSCASALGAPSFIVYHAVCIPRISTCLACVVPLYGRRSVHTRSRFKHIPGLSHFFSTETAVSVPFPVRLSAVCTDCSFWLPVKKSRTYHRPAPFLLLHTSLHSILICSHHCHQTLRSISQYAPKPFSPFFTGISFTSMLSICTNLPAAMVHVPTA